MKIAKKPKEKPTDHGAEFDRSVEDLADLVIADLNKKAANDPQLSHSSLEKMKQEFHSDMNLFRSRFMHGYHVLLEQISHDPHHPLTKAKIRKMVLPHHPIENTLTANRKFAKKLEKGTPLGGLLGFSDEAVGIFYEAAVHLLEGKHGSDAADAFFFLSSLYPQVSAFWLGMARSEELNHHLDKALVAYQMAIITDSHEPTHYIEAVRCCLKMGELTKAEEILNHALFEADKHPYAHYSALLRSCALQGKTDLHKIKS